MSLTTLIGMLFLFCAAAAEKGPPQYKWFFESTSTALVGVGFAASADQWKRPRGLPVSMMPSPVQVVVNEQQSAEQPKE